MPFLISFACDRCGICVGGMVFHSTDWKKVGWGDDSKGLSSVPLDLKMQQSKQWECGELGHQRNPWNGLLDFYLNCFLILQNVSPPKTKGQLGVNGFESILLENQAVTEEMLQVDWSFSFSPGVLWSSAGDGTLSGRGVELLQLLPATHRSDPSHSVLPTTHRFMDFICTMRNSVALLNANSYGLIKILIHR